MTKTPAFDHAKHARLEALVAEANQIVAERGKAEKYIASYEYCAARYLNGRLWNTDISIETLERIIAVERTALQHGL